MTIEDLKNFNAALKIYPKLHKLEDLPVPESKFDLNTSAPQINMEALPLKNKNEA